jgi:hypothetical protein
MEQRKQPSREPSRFTSAPLSQE